MQQLDDGFPTYSDIELPLLKEIVRQGGKARVEELYRPLADFFGLTLEQLTIMRPNKCDHDPRWANDVQTTRKQLLKKGELHPTEVSGRHIYQIIPTGEAWVEGSMSL